MAMFASPLATKAPSVSRKSVNARQAPARTAIEETENQKPEHSVSIRDRDWGARAPLEAPGAEGNRIENPHSGVPARRLQWSIANVSMAPHVEPPLESKQPLAGPRRTLPAKLVEERSHENGIRSSEGLGETGKRRNLPEPVLRALRSSQGERLPDPLAAGFSRKFGHDLSTVTIKHGEEAAEAVRSIGANAFARGGDVFFRQGAYRPESKDGQALLAHELAHVVQQSGGGRLSSARGGAAEESAQRASLEQREGRDSLDAGPRARLGIAADNGFTFEDEEAQRTVQSTEDEAADRVLDIEDNANRSRAQLGVTDAGVAAKDEHAQKIRDQVQTSLARKEKAASKRKPAGKQKPKPAAAKAPPGINSSPDLRSASSDEVEAQRRARAKAQILSTDPKQRVRLGRDLDNTETAAGAAEKRERARSIKHQILSTRADLELLEQQVVESNERRKNTSSLVTGTIHFWGGAWTEIKGEDFAMANLHIGEAKKALEEGRLDEAWDSMEDAKMEYEDLQYQYDEYGEGIQKGGRRAIIGAAAAPFIPLAIAAAPAVAGAGVATGSAIGGGVTTVVEGTAAVAQAYPIASATIAGLSIAAQASEAITGKSTGILNPGRAINALNPARLITGAPADIGVGRDLSGSERAVSLVGLGLDLLGMHLGPRAPATPTGGTDPMIPSPVDDVAAVGAAGGQAGQSVRALPGTGVSDGVPAGQLRSVAPDGTKGPVNGNPAAQNRSFPGGDAANDNLHVTPQSQAQRVPVAATGTDGGQPVVAIDADMTSGDLQGAGGAQMVRKPTSRTPARIPTRPEVRPAPPAGHPADTVEKFEQRGGVIQNKGVKTPTPDGPTAQPKDENFDQQKAKKLGDSDGSPETEAVYEANKGQAGMAEKPLHHVFPQNAKIRIRLSNGETRLQNSRQWFQKRGFVGERDIDQSTVKMEEAYHQAVHGGGDYKLGKTDAFDWNSKVADTLGAAEAALGGRMLTYDEIFAIVLKLMREYAIPQHFVPYK